MAVIQAEVTSTEFRFGTQSLQITTGSTGQNAIYPTADIAVQPSTAYIFSAYIKTPSPLTDGGVQLQVAQGGSFTPLLAQGADLITDTSSATENGWQRISVAFTTPAGIFSVRPMVVYTGATAAQVFYLDGVKFEPGTVATLWQENLVSTGAVFDAIGMVVDGTANGIFRLLGSGAGDRDTVSLSTHGLTFGGDTELYSPASGVIEVPGLQLGADVLLQRGGAGILQVDNGLYVGAAGAYSIYGPHSIELFDASNPFIDFKNAFADDYDARIIYNLSGSGKLSFYGADVRLESGVELYMITPNIRSDTEFSFLTTGGAAQIIQAKGLLVSGSYGDPDPATAGIQLGADVNLYRYSANILKTDDHQWVGGQLAYRGSYARFRRNAAQSIAAAAWTSLSFDTTDEQTATSPPTVSGTTVTVKDPLARSGQSGLWLVDFEAGCSGMANGVRLIARVTVNGVEKLEAWTTSIEGSAFASGAHVLALTHNDTLTLDILQGDSAARNTSGGYWHEYIALTYMGDNS